MNDIVMPRLSDSMTEGTVVRWLKQPGEAIVRGEPIVEIETDKATITYEADLDGVLAEILVGEGQTVPVGEQIARIESAGQAGAVPGAAPGQTTPATEQFAPAAPPPPVTPAPNAAPPRPAAVAPEHAAEPGGRVKASPIARRLARKLGVDIESVAGTGPGGRIVKEDVEAAASSPPPPAQPPSEPQPQFEASTEQFAQPSAPKPLPLPPDEEAAEQFQGYTDEEPALAPPGASMPPLPQEQPAFAPQAPQTYAPQAPSAFTPQEQYVSPSAPGLPPLPPPGTPGGYPAGPPAMAPGAPPFAYPPQQPSVTGPLPGPAPFVSGMTGGFPAISPQPPGQLPGQPQAPQAPGLTATRGQSSTSVPTSAQQTVARRMAESKATAPDFFVEVEVDMTNAVNYREQLKPAVLPTPSFNDMVIKAAALSLRQHPKVNGAYKDGRFEQYGDVNVGFVVAAGDLLAMPTLFNADQKGLAQIARESRELATAVRNHAIQPAQLSGGTFSVSNLGMYGVERFTAILNPPQAAILAVGAIKRRPVIAEDGVSLAVRQTMSLTITCDHRILYGTDGAEFLAAVKAWLESPQSLPV